MKTLTQNKTKKLQKILVPNRISILQLLLSKDTCVCEMVETLKLKHNLISHHLKTLQDIKYIKSTRKGTHIIYSLREDKKPIVEEIIKILERNI